MTTKHTAGEWIDRGTSCVGARRQLVASVYPMEDEHPEEHAANMRLIAAAPEMLLALRSAVNDADAWGLADDECDWLPIARAAIARATGEQP